MGGECAGALLRRARDAAGLTQGDLAERAGVPQSVLSAYERDRRQPSADALIRILDAAGYRLKLVPRVDEARAGRMLVDLLALADRLPSRRGELRFPRLP